MIGFRLCLIACSAAMFGITADGQSIYDPFLFVSFAGAAGTFGFSDGVGAAARFNSPTGIAVDATRNLYVADTGNHTIRRIAPDGTVTTQAGLPGTLGSADGRGTAARFASPQGMAVAPDGTLYVADADNHTIRRINPDGFVSTFAGLAGSSGTTDDVGNAARFRNPTGLTIDSAGNIYVGDTFNHTIRKITPLGAVTTLAGSPGNSGAADGFGTAARFNFPRGLAVDTVGNVYVADAFNFAIRKVTPAGLVSTLAGILGSGGSEDGPANQARFFNPRAITMDSADNLYIADTNNNAVRRITPAGMVTTLAGLPGSDGSNDGAGTGARFVSPQGIGVDHLGNVYLSDTGNNEIRVGGAVARYETLSVSRLPNHNVLLSGHAPPNATVGIYASSSPSTATAPMLLSTIKADSAGVFTFEDLNSSSVPRWFYTASIPPLP